MIQCRHGARVGDRGAPDPPALVERGAKVESAVAAAGLGRLDLLKRVAFGATKEQLEQALIMAARYGRSAVVA